MTSTPTRPVDNGFYNKRPTGQKQQLFDEWTVENIGKLILSLWLSTATRLNKARFLMSSLSLIEINVLYCHAVIITKKNHVICADFRSFFIAFLSNFIVNFYIILLMIFTIF